MASSSFYFSVLGEAGLVTLYTGPTNGKGELTWEDSSEQQVKQASHDDMIIVGWGDVIYHDDQGEEEENVDDAF